MGASGLRNKTTASATRRLFRLLEDKFGGLAQYREDAPVLHRCYDPNEGIRTDDLRKLTSHKISALHLSSYFGPATAAEALGNALAEERPRQNWKVHTARGLESSDVSTLGRHPPSNVIFGGPFAPSSEERLEYFRAVRHEMAYRRQKHGGWPLDRLRLELDEAWPAGAGLARIGEHPLPAGLPRVMVGPTRWKQGFIHVDDLAPLDIYEGTFSANLYLKLPNDDNDGPRRPHLQVWPLGIYSRWHWYFNAYTLSGLMSQDSESQHALRAALGEPHSIVVAPGDLVLLSVQRPHAAVGISSGTRVSLQCFIQHHGHNQRLLVDG